MSANLVDLKARDVAIKVITKCGGFRLMAVNAKHVFKETLVRHRLVQRTHGHKDFLQQVGDNIVFSNLLASTLRQEERVTTRFASAHQATCVAEAMAIGECRSYVVNSPPDGAVAGALRVDRVLYEQAKAVTSVTVAAANDAAALLAGMDNVTQSDISTLMDSSLTVHASNFFSRSEGIRSAVLLRSDVTEGPSQSLDDWTAPYCAGFLLQPILDSADGDGSFAPPFSESLKVLDELQRCALQSLVPSSDVQRMWRSIISGRAQECKTVMQDILSLVTGDFDGAFAIAEQCRQPTSSIERCARELEPLRSRVVQSRHGERPVVFELDVGSATRTPIDFFCRCSKANFLGALRTLSAEQVRAAQGQPVSCQYCRKVMDITPSEWESVQKI